MVTHTAESIKKIFRASGGAARFPRKRKAICHGLCYDKNMEKGSSAAGCGGRKRISDGSRGVINHVAFRRMVEAQISRDRGFENLGDGPLPEGLG